MARTQGAHSTLAAAVISLGVLSPHATPGQLLARTDATMSIAGYGQLFTHKP